MPEVVLRNKSGQPLLLVSDDGRFLITPDGNFFGQVVAANRLVGQTAALPTFIVYPVSEDGSYEIDGNVLVTTVGTINANFLINYTDEGGTGRSLQVVQQILNGTPLTNVQTLAPYHNYTMNIRAKAGTNITVAFTGTFTGSPVYNIEARIRRVQ